MIRIIIDRLGTGHDDIFLKIDAMPSYSKTVDSYYLFDFLEIADNDIKKLDLEREEILRHCVDQLIDYWIERINIVDKGKNIFLPFDLCDEYTGGLLLEKRNNGFRIKMVFTEKIPGYGVGKSNLDSQIKENNISFDDELNVEWLLSEDSILKGLEWSKSELMR